MQFVTAWTSTTTITTVEDVVTLVIPTERVVTDSVCVVPEPLPAQTTRTKCASLLTLWSSADPVLPTATPSLSRVVMCLRLLVSRAMETSRTPTATPITSVLLHAQKVVPTATPTCSTVAKSLFPRMRSTVACVATTALARSAQTTSTLPATTVCAQALVKLASATATNRVCQD